MKRSSKSYDANFPKNTDHRVSIHLTFTSPPYDNACDYSIYASYHAYLDFLTEVFTQVHRMTKEGRFLNQDYRTELGTLVNARFLQYVVDFFLFHRLWYHTREDCEYTK